MAKVKQVADSIVYTNPFRDSVQGHLKAQFRLDREGKPSYEAL